MQNLLKHYRSTSLPAVTESHTQNVNSNIELKHLSIISYESNIAASFLFAFHVFEVTFIFVMTSLSHATILVINVAIGTHMQFHFSCGVYER